MALLAFVLKVGFNNLVQRTLGSCFDVLSSILALSPVLKSFKFKADDPNLNIIVVNKKKGATTAKQLKVSSVKIKQILLHRENIEMLFADAVVLTEDLKFFLQMSATELADITLGGENWLDSCNISILNCGGKDEIYKYASILQQLEIPFYVVADFDFLKEGLNNYLKT